VSAYVELKPRPPGGLTVLGEYAPEEGERPPVGRPPWPGYRRILWSARGEAVWASPPGERPRRTRAVRAGETP
jgi:hypothetical protein